VPLIDHAAAQNPKAAAAELIEWILHVITAVSFLTSFGSLFQSRQVFFSIDFRFGWLILSHRRV
jgi:hypothetical protein